MTEPFKSLDEADKHAARNALNDWLGLCDLILSHLEKNWKAKGVSAQFNSDDEIIVVFHVGGYGKIFRKGAKFIATFPSNEKLKEFDADYEWYTRGRNFIGWHSNISLREDITTILDLALSEFVNASSKLMSARAARMKLDDIQNGYSEYE